MSKHEKHLLLVMLFLQIWIVTGIVTASMATGEKILTLIGSIRIPSITFIFFGLIGILGMYYELTTFSNMLSIFESSGEEIPIETRQVMGGGLGLTLTLLLILSAYRTNLLGFANFITVIGLGFSIVVLLMFIGAILSRIYRSNHTP